MEKIPKEEINHRIDKFQEILRQRDLDGSILMQNVDMYYFSGTIQSSILFIPAEGEPILGVVKNIERAKSESSLEHIISINGKHQIPGILEDYGFSSLRSLGLEMDVLPANLYLWCKESFPRVLWVDVSEHIKRLRMMKSSYEIENIRAAAKILHVGFTEIREIIREGITELEIDGHLAFIARREGHMGILRMRGWNQEMTYAHVLSGDSGAVPSFLDSPHGGTGNTPAMAQGAGFRKIRRDEPIGIDFGAGVEGYLADQFRTYCIGKLPVELEVAHNCSRRIHILFSEKAKPGFKARDLYHMALAEAEEMGLRENFMGCGKCQVRFIGHGLGLEIDEYPIISPHFEGEIQEGMVIALEPKFVFPGKGVVGLEDDYLITASGVDRLTLTKQELISVQSR